MLRPRTRQLVFGYIRVDAGAPDDDLIQLELIVRSYADAAGYCFASFFYEDDEGGMSAFVELIDALARTPVRRVIVPSGDHIACNPRLRAVRIDQLEERTGARVLVLGECA